MAAVAAAAATTTRTAAAAAADRLKSFIPPSDRTGGFLSFFTGKNVVYYIKRRCFPWISAPLNDTIAAMYPRCRRLAANTPFCSPCCKSRTVCTCCMRCAPPLCSTIAVRCASPAAAWNAGNPPPPAPCGKHGRSWASPPTESGSSEKPTFCICAPSASCVPWWVCSPALNRKPSP